MVPRRFAKTKSDLRAALRVSGETVRTWVARDDFPPGPPWDLDDVVRWARDMRSRSKARGDGAETAEIFEDLSQPGPRRGGDDPKTIKIKLEAALLGERLKREKGEVIPRESVSKLLTARLREWKRAGRGMSRRLRAQLLGCTDGDVFEQTFLTEFDRLLWQAYGRSAEMELDGTHTDADTGPDAPE